MLLALPLGLALGVLFNVSLLNLWPSAPPASEVVAPLLLPEPAGEIAPSAAPPAWTLLHTIGLLTALAGLMALIQEDGSVADAQIVKGLGGGLDEEALRVVQNLTFTPGKQDGKAVPVTMSLPVAFTL